MAAEDLKNQSQEETAETAKGSPSQSSYEGPRISKPNMFMAIALWMERSPFAQSPSEYLLPRRDQGNSISSETNEIQHGATAQAVQEGSTSKLQGKPVAQASVDEIEIKKYNKSGAVFVLPNDRALSVDCSQEGVHAAVSALNKFGHERAKGCQVYLSRRPCSFCAKLLIQCEVSKVYYLPIEPELDDANDARIVDNMFMTSSCGLSIKVPRIDEAVVKDHDKKISPYTGKRPTKAEDNFSDVMVSEYWSSDWIGRASDVLNWPAFRDVSLQIQITSDMESLMKWVAHTTVNDVPDNIIFVGLNEDCETKKQNIPGESGDGTDGDTVSGMESGDTASTDDETPRPSPQQHAGSSSMEPRKRNEADGKALSTSDKEWQSNALHKSRLAQMLSQRSDDPTRRVGCVLLVHGEIAAIGWNGFPAKALFGEFPRASHTEEERNKKEPYVIHAEQNALLTRNQNLHDDSSILFINEVPCDECVPLLIQAGVKKIVIPKLESAKNAGDQISGIGDSRESFEIAFNENKFDCYGSKRSPVRRNLSKSM